MIECKKSSCEDCKLSVLRNGLGKICYELTEEEVEVALERSESNEN